MFKETFLIESFWETVCKILEALLFRKRETLKDFSNLFVAINYFYFIIDVWQGLKYASVT